MATEIELKLALAPEDVPCFKAHPALAAVTPRVQGLLNTYYDTPELALSARKMALRLRKKGEEWLLTVKTAEKSIAGLSCRNEWEAPASPGGFDFSHVDQAPLRHYLESLIPQLTAIFTTDFQRQTWVLQRGAARIEVALDQGQIESRGQRAPLCEVELELLTGEPEDLRALADELGQSVTLVPSEISKAQRGYRLFAQRNGQAA